MGFMTLFVSWLCFYIGDATSDFHYSQPAVPRSTSWKSWKQCPLSNSWTNISLRYPPTVRYNSADRGWVAPPRSFIYGNWHVTHSSRFTYQSLYNFQADCYPVLPTNGSENTWRQVDLTSWNFAPTGNATADNFIGTAFGYDTPRIDIAPFVFQFRGEGPVFSSVSNMWELVGWGIDTTGSQYRVEYETATTDQIDEPCFNIVSREKNGPSEETLKAILMALKNAYADDQNLSAYTRNITSLPEDARRDRLGPVACDEACMMNTWMTMG